VFICGGSQLMLRRGGCGNKVFKLAGAIPGGAEIFAFKAAQEFIFKLLHFVVSFQQTGSDIVADEWFGDVFESGESRDVIAIDVSESFGLSMSHINQPPQFRSGIICGGVGGAEFLESSECFVEKFDAVFSECSVELTFELQNFVAVAGPEQEGFVVAECLGDGFEQIDGGAVVVLLSGLAGFAVEFCGAFVQEFGEVCSCGLQEFQMWQTVGGLLQLIAGERHPEFRLKPAHSICPGNGFAIPRQAAAVFGDLCEQFCGGLKVGLLEALFGLFSKTEQFCFELIFEFAAPAAGMKEPAVLKVAKFFDVIEAFEDCGEVAVGEG
jgi:hypothetical protein